MPSLATLRRLVRLHPYASALCAAGALATLFFATRMLVFALYWAEPDHRRMDPEPWMTPRYVAHAWEVSPQELAAFLAIPDGAPKRPTLADIARLRGIPVDRLITELQAWLNEHAPPADPANGPEQAGG